jgi:HKD family nuclease
MVSMGSGLVFNDSMRGVSFSTTLEELLRDAAAIDLAVSYVQASGWDSIQRLTTKIDPTKIRLLVTDQFGISHPDTLRKAKDRGAEVRAYVGGRIYHPKVYIIYDSQGRPSSAIVGSANLSGAALEMSIEAGCRLTNEKPLTELVAWFEQLFRDHDATVVDEKLLKKLEGAWKSAAAARVQVTRVRRKSLPKSVQSSASLAEEIDVLEDLFYTIELPIGILSIDQAGNNIRNLARLLEVLRRHPAIGAKERSELHLLGFLSDGKLTDLGKSAKQSNSEKDVAQLWCEWVLKGKVQKLRDLNPRIASFRRAATQFWNLQPEVRQFFFTNLHSERRRNVLKVIELLCSGSEVVCKLEVDDFESLVPAIARAQQLPQFLRRAVLDYWDNKGSRSWGSDDRRTLLTAWRRISERRRRPAR